MRTEDPDVLDETVEELFEDAPCGYVATRLNGTIVRVNRTFEAWTGRHREELVGRVRFQDLLTPGGRIYHETHLAPLLQMQGAVREIAVEILRADGSTLPALVNSTLRAQEAGRDQLIGTTVFDATDRRRYERELLRVRERERGISRQLQRSLLAGELPSAPGVELDFFLSPAERGTEAGGDWYDAFWLREGSTLALVIGDVVGRGIGAAATMGQLRSAVRALAGTMLSPGALLSALDGYCARHAIGTMTTLTYARLELSTRRLWLSRAGHPPPLVVEADGAARYLWDGRSLPLNVLPGERAEVSVTLSPGSLLLLYTDGLIEDRGRPHEDGMERLLDHVAAHRNLPLPELLSDSARLLRDHDRADDVCLLAARLG